MTAIKSENQVVATLFTDDDFYVALALPGKATIEEAHAAGLKNREPMSIWVTERMLMDMNGMMRAKWEAIKNDADSDWQKRKSNPLTPNQCF